MVDSTNPQVHPDPEERQCEYSQRYCSNDALRHMRRVNEDDGLKNQRIVVLLAGRRLQMQMNLLMKKFSVQSIRTQLLVAKMNLKMNLVVVDNVVLIDGTKLIKICEPKVARDQTHSRLNSILMEWLKMMTIVTKLKLMQTKMIWVEMVKTDDEEAKDSKRKSRMEC